MKPDKLWEDDIIGIVWDDGTVEPVIDFPWPEDELAIEREWDPATHKPEVEN